MTSVTIGGSVTNIGLRAFSDCVGLENVVVPDSVESIGDYAFYGCSGLAGLTMGNGVASIGNHAFHGCVGLSDVVIPNSVESIGDYAFYGCSWLRSLTIGNGVSSIGNYAFADCHGLVHVSVGAQSNLKRIGEAAFSGCYNIDAGSFIVPDTVVEIGKDAFPFVFATALDGTISGHVILEKKAVYTVSNSVTVESGATLTVLPGTVLKFQVGSFLVVNGTLNVQGARTSPVVFTSIKDDANGGDTNGDGAGSLPYPGDWGGVIAKGGRIEAEYAQFLYGGGVDGNVYGARASCFMWDNASGEFLCCRFAGSPMDGCFAQNATFGNCIFDDNDRGLVSSSGTIVADNCVAANNRIGFFSHGSPLVVCNSISSLNTESAITGDGGSRKTYNCYFGEDPKFFDPMNGDYRIAADSPCVDAGDAAYAPSKDWYGSPRYAMTYGGEVKPDIGIYEVLPRLVAGDVDLSAVSVATIGGAFSVGDTVTVRWTVRNVGTETAVGPWSDTISVIDASGAVITLGSRTTLQNLVAGASISSEAQFVLPAMAEGAARVRLTVNSGRDVFEGALTANNTMSPATTFNVTLPVLAVGAGMQLSVPAGSSSAFKLPRDSDATVLLVSGGVGISACGASGYVPRLNRSDTVAIRLEGGSLSGLLMMTIPKDSDAEGFTVVVNNGGSASECVVVSTERRALTIADVSPSRLASGVSGSVLVRGIWPDGVTSVRLDGSTQISATAVENRSVSEISATFDLASAASGSYALVITDADGHSDRLDNAVEIYKPLEGPKLEARIEGPSAVRVGRIITARIVYSNVGDTPMRAPYFKLSSGNSKFRLDGEEEWQEGYVEVMGLGSGIDPGILGPGESGCVTYEFISLGGAQTRLESDADTSDNWAIRADAAASAASRVNRRGRRVVRYSELDRYAKEFREHPDTSNAACGMLCDGASGEPLAGAEVCAMSADGELLSSDTVDDNGVFVLEGLPSATNLVLSVIEGTFADDLPIVMPASGDLLDLKWYGTKGWTINVSVDGAEAADFAEGIEIDIMRLGDDGTTARLILTNAVDGVASTTVRESGIYIVRAKTHDGKEQFAVVECEADAKLAEVVVDFAAGYSVSGVVADTNGNRLSGALLSLSPKGEMNGYSRTVTSGEDGAFSFGCIDDGEYVLSWTKNGYGSDVAVDVVVCGGDVSGLSLRCMAFDQKISGKVNAECAGMTAAFATSAGGSVTATIAEDGTFTLEGLPAGRGTFSVMDESGNIIYMLRDLYVRPGANALDVTAETELCNVIGATVDENGAPVEAVWLFTSTSGDGGAGYANANGKCLTKLRKATYDVSVAAEGFVTRMFRRKIEDSCKLTTTLVRGGSAKITADSEACLVAFSSDGIAGDGVEAQEEGTVSGAFTNGTEVTAFVVCLDGAYRTDSISIAAGTTGTLSRVEGGRALVVTATGNKTDVTAFRVALADGSGFVATWPVENGKLELSEFPPVAAVVSAVAPDGSIISSAVVAADATSATVATSAALPVAGHIVDDMPALLAGGAVSFGKDGGNILATAEITPFGTFRADYVSAEYERVWVQLPNGLVFSVSRAEAEAVNFAITPPNMDDTGLSQLKVVDEGGEPVEGAEVDVKTADGYEATLTTDCRGIVRIVTVVRDEPPKYDPPRLPEDPPKKTPEIKPENPTFDPTPEPETKKPMERENDDHSWMCQTCRCYPCRCKVKDDDGSDEAEKNMQNRCPNCGQVIPCSCQEKGDKDTKDDNSNPIKEEPVTEPELEELTLDDIPDLDLPQKWDFSGKWYDKYCAKVSDLTATANKLYKEVNPNYHTCMVRNCNVNEQIYLRYSKAKAKALEFCACANGALSELYRKEQVAKGNISADVAIGFLSFFPGYGQVASIGLDVIRNMQSGMTLGQALRSEIASVAGMVLSKWQAARNTEMAAIKYWDGMSFRYSKNGLSERQLLKTYRKDMAAVAKLNNARDASLGILDILPTAQRMSSEIENLNVDLQLLYSLVVQTELFVRKAEQEVVRSYHKCGCGCGEGCACWGLCDNCQCGGGGGGGGPHPSPNNPIPPYPKSWPEPESKDPNEVAGPLGVGDRRYVAAGSEMLYTVYFENKSTASAAAQDIYITNPLSEWLDWSTFEMRDVGFCNQTDHNLNGLRSGISEVALKDTPYFVQSSVSLDDKSGCVKIELHIIDKNTKYGVPEDPYAGILPPNDSTHRGEGHVTYRIKLRDDAPSNLVVRNSATIVFDYNDPIETDPAWWNTVGIAYDTVLDLGNDVTTNLILVAGQPFGELPTPSKLQGYVFDAWFTGLDGTGIKATPDATVPESAFALYANWLADGTDTPGARKVVFDAIGGRIGALGVVTQDLAAAYGTLPYPTRADHAFEGWFLGVTNGAPQAESGGVPLASDDHTLFARWSVTVAAALPDGTNAFSCAVADANTARITGFTNPGQTASTLVIPDYIGGRAVTEVEVGAFANSTSGLEHVVFPAFCTNVGDKAFIGVSSLTSATFPDVRRWDDPAQRSPVRIGEYAFSGTGLSAVVLPDGVVSVGDYAFANCKSLVSVTILGHPTIGVQPFRRSGNGSAGGVVVHLDPALAGDDDFMDALVQQCGNVVVRTDAVVSGVSVSALSMSPKKVKLSMSVDRASSWGEIDKDSVRVNYRASLGDGPMTLVPDSVTENGDGSLTVEVSVPEGQSGFFQATIGK